MKLELVVAHDFPLFGEMRKTGTVLGTFDLPAGAKADSKENKIGPKLRNAVAGSHLEFRIVADKSKGRDKGKDPKPADGK